MKSLIKKACYYVLIVLQLPVLIDFCKKHTGSAADALVIVTPLSRPQGISAGTGITKVIGAAGGALCSPDETIALIISAGALDANTTISIQSITNTNIAGIGQALRRIAETPHTSIYGVIQSRE